MTTTATPADIGNVTYDRGRVRVVGGTSTRVALVRHRLARSAADCRRVSVGVSAAIDKA